MVIVETIEDNALQLILTQSYNACMHLSRLSSISHGLAPRLRSPHVLTCVIFFLIFGFCKIPIFFNDLNRSSIQHLIFQIMPEATRKQHKRQLLQPIATLQSHPLYGKEHAKCTCVCESGRSFLATHSR